MQPRSQPQPSPSYKGNDVETDAPTRLLIDDAAFGSFLAALDNAPAPGPKLRALMRRKPAWAD